MLELCNITQIYGENRVLADFSLTLAPGQRLALMGPSGRGKTTALRIALGLLRPTAGTVVNTFARPAAVFQEPRLLPWATAGENVALVLPGRDPRAAARPWLEALELSDSAGKYPRELSGGMQQRIAIARALATEPDLLVLDEPFKAMDDALRRRVMDLTARSAAAILLVTHDRAEAEALGCRIRTL